MRISVVIAVKDRLPELQIAVASIASQSNQPDEVVIVDDGSARPHQLEDFIGFAPGLSILIVRNETSLGGGPSFKRGVEHASGDIVALLDSDDCLHEHYIAIIRRAWAQAAATTLCHTVGFYWCLNDFKPYRTQIPGIGVTYADLATAGNVLGGSSVISARRSAYLAAVEGQPRVSYDWDLLLKLARAGRIETIREPLLYYRSPSDSPLQSYTRSHRRQIIAKSQIVRQLPAEFRSRGREKLLSYAAMSLAMAGRKRMSRRMLRLMIKRRIATPRQTVEILMVLLAGPRAHRLVIKAAAHARAKLAREPRPNLRINPSAV